MKKLLFSVTLNDCRVDTFRSGGKGGQHQNTTDSGVRIVHLASGAVGECREDRHQHINKKIAFKRMAESKKFKLWAKLKASDIILNKTIDEVVEEQLHPNNIKVEIKDENGLWKETNIIN